MADERPIRPAAAVKEKDSFMKRLSDACAGCCSSGPSDAELEKLRSSVAQEREAQRQAEKAALQLQAELSSYKEKAQAEQMRSQTLCGELKEQLVEAKRRAGELLEGEQRLRSRAEAELLRETNKTRAECQAQFEALEQRLGDQLRIEKARVLELQNYGNGKDVKALEAHIAELEKANVQQQGELVELQQKEEEAKGSVEPLESLSNALRSTRDGLAREVAELDVKVQSSALLKDRIIEREAQILELEGTVAGIATLHEDISHQREACVVTEGMMQRLQSEEQMVSEQVASWQSDALALCLELESAERQASALEVSEETLQSKIRNEAEQVTKLEQQLDAANGDVAALTRQVTEKREANTRVSVLAATRNEVRATQSVIQQQEAQMEALRGQVEKTRQAYHSELARQARVTEKIEVEEQAQKARQARIEARTQRLEKAAAPKAKAPKAKPPSPTSQAGKARPSAVPKARASVLSSDGKQTVSDRLLQPQSRAPTQVERTRRKAENLSVPGVNE